jgi:N-acetyltransferase 10
MYISNVHSQVVQPRFNERFLLSLSTCETCAVMDDELNILPLSKHIRKIEPVELDGEGEIGSSVAQSADDLELAELKRSLEDTQPAAALVGVAKTRDQAKAVLTFIEAVSEKTLRSTVVLTAARGRGKSAALGVGIASAVAYGYSNIFVTSPAPENLATVFEFVFKVRCVCIAKYMPHHLSRKSN